MKIIKVATSLLVGLIICSGCQENQAQLKGYDQSIMAHHLRADDFSSSGQWTNYGNDPGGMRYSPLNKINKANVAGLEVAWTYRTGELETYTGTDISTKAAFEATPIMVDGVIYLSTPTNRVIAVAADSGKEKWVYNPMVDLRGDYSEVTCRGVSKWIDSEKVAGQPGYMRILVGTIDGRLIALDYQTGAPIPEFGPKGQVDLKKGIGRIQVTSPPAVIGDLIIIGSTMGDNWRTDYPAGVVRAFNARSGEMMWSWDPIPRKSTDPGYETWKGRTAHKTGAANAWAPLSVDVDRDLVFVPTSCPSVDYYGGERLGSNLYANSLVALKASTGVVQWHFQTVHHDIWDYDLPAQPLLIDVEKDSVLIPVVTIVTKMGHIFAFNRETGESIFPIEEREVPVSNVPGEEAWPTQPFPVLPPPLGLREVTLDHAWGTTSEMESEAREIIGRMDNRGVFTPPSLEGTIVIPSNVGGMNWGGASFDPERNLLVTGVNHIAALITLFPKGDGNSRASVNKAMPRAEVAPQEGTPYVMSRDYLLTRDPGGGMVIQTKPPWGTLAAVNMTTGEIKWEVPMGIMLDPQEYPGAENWGSPIFGGPLTTAGGVTFMAATVDNLFRALDTDTGSQLWVDSLPAGGQATPMTYEWEGKQYVVISAGGHGKLGTPLGDYVVAYSLE